ncbi:SPOR domain-containing protein [Sphingobium fluviale]|uniref:SPOR domain-containing protein n=2 Tax=Sphingobium fluviale TaxID=2506423 RepID=A0A4Q1KHT5_9SPHN|nr:SPOR domain-containing protein [Sphingobium fluviale]
MALVPCAQAQMVAAPSSQLQLKPTDAGTALATAMTRLAASPRDFDALIKAGEASLELEDPRSAIGFFGRADDITADNGRVKAGLGRAMLQLDQIGDGLRLMELAGNLGYSDFGLLADRGLARDLAANQAGAQADYAAALRLNPDDAKVIRRQAVSYGISGQVDLADKTLQPLLYKSDRAAWRDKAFILAMNGRTAEAVKIAGQVMPAQLATAIKPYLERMTALSPAQRAAAVHLGRFPPGLVNVQVASTRPAASAPVSTPAPLPPAPKPAPTVTAAKPAPVTPAATPAATAKPAAATAPAPQGGASVAQLPASAPAQRAVQGPPAPVPSQAPAQVASAPPPPPARPAPSPGISSRSLADIMAEIEIPQSELAPRVAAVDLSDVASLKAAKKKAQEAAAKKKAEAEAKAKADAEKKRLAANPARYWVQIGTGRNKSALAFTLKRMKKEHDVLAKQDGFSAAWGATNRLVVGPFKSLERAKAVEADLKKAGSDAFVWRSDAGEELEALGGN